LSDINLDDLPVFDLEYLFMHLRARSVSEVVNLKYRCNNLIKDEKGEDKDCGTINEISFNVLEIKPTINEGHTNKFQLTDKVGIVMKYPTFELMQKASGKEDNEIIMDLIYASIEQVYDKIADQFNNTRYKIWGSVKTFMDGLPKDASVLELGCGNGKNMLYRSDINIKGIDISNEQVIICKRKNLDVEKGNITELKFDNDSFDFMICIATYHHLDNDIDRQKCLKEMYRCLKYSGEVFITVWAMEQQENSSFNFTQTDEMVPWKSKDDGNTYLRYYHIYRKDELRLEITRLCPEFKIMKIDWELGNWYVLLKKD
jgi:ubiquinone/menaquinone biosynthesis C-methylase UbiE